MLIRFWYTAFLSRDFHTPEHFVYTLFLYHCHWYWRRRLQGLECILQALRVKCAPLRVHASTQDRHLSRKKSATQHYGSRQWDTMFLVCIWKCQSSDININSSNAWKTINACLVVQHKPPMLLKHDYLQYVHCSRKMYGNSTDRSGAFIEYGFEMQGRWTCQGCLCGLWSLKIGELVVYTWIIQLIIFVKTPLW